MSNVHDLRIEALARRAPEQPLKLSEDDRAYVLKHLAAVEEAFGIRAVPDVPLTLMPARAFVRHLAGLRAGLDPQGLEQRLALGRLESVFRLVASAIAVMGYQSRVSA